jgi:hypothetical protein
MVLEKSSAHCKEQEAHARVRQARLICIAVDTVKKHGSRRLYIEGIVLSFSRWVESIN